jgi:M3 family oligoendopeptidase
MEFENFNDVKTLKPDVEAIKKQMAEITEELKNAKNSQEAIDAVKKEFAVNDKISTDYQIAYIRHTINIHDDYYNDLMDFYDNNLPLLSSFEDAFDKVLVATAFKKEISKEFGEYLFTKVEMQMKVFKPDIIPDLQEENNLASQYNKIMGNAKGMFRGEEKQITEFDPLLTSADREVRKDAAAGYWGFFKDNEAALADVYDKLVKVRTRIAKKLGYDNFLPVGYLRLGRSDYGPEEVAHYRDHVYKNIVPLAESLYDKQRERLGITDFKFYDYKLEFNTGNPKPQGTPEELVTDAKKMYSEMNPIASKYFNFMVSHNLMDLVAKDGKIPGGYMTYIPNLKSSFIFSNFNGSAGDVDVLTHEFGHSLQGFLAADIPAPQLRSPGYELCEIHSMSMEFLAYPWIQYFFGQEAEKYRYAHLVEDIKFIPYGVSVDEFQAFVYTHPDCTHEERKAAWRAIEKKYLPHLHYGEDNPFLESGGYWMRQLHIYVDPLYYIDYTIAQVGAFEFYVESLSDFKKAFAKYLNFDRLGGQYPYKQLLKKAHIADPMEPETIPSLIPVLKKVLDSTDDKKL